jgi:NAD(P)-dependent dehydrogenase (short-subunit alcohol dehydrogenase family)
MKTIVISGANRGIGLELTRVFAKDNRVYALCRNNFPTSELNDHITVVKLDITNESAIQEFADELNNKNIAVDLLINNAGIDGGDDNKNVQVDVKSLTEVFVTNTVGPMMLSLNLKPALERADHPAMLAVSSRMGTHALLNEYNAEWWPYSASKAALSLAVSAFAIRSPAIKSISVHPGWVKTRMGGTEAAIESVDSAQGIKKLYETIDELETGKLYNYDGTLMDW